MMPDRHGGLIADRHVAKYCPYCREGRVCPTVTAQRRREAAKRILRTPVPRKERPGA